MATVTPTATKIGLHLLVMLTGLAAHASDARAEAVLPQPIPRQSGMMEQAPLDNVIGTQPLPPNILPPQETSRVPPYIPAPPEQSQPEEPVKPRVGTKTLLAPDKPATPPRPAPPPPPDETVLWRLLDQGQYEALDATVESLRRQHPAWQPPAELLRLARENRLKRDITTAITLGDDVRLAALGDAEPRLFSCDHIDWAWALAKAHATLGREHDAQAVLRRLIPFCTREDDRLATLHKARDWLTEAAWEDLLEAERPALRSAAGEASYQRLRYDHALEKLVSASQSQDTRRVMELFTTLAADITAYQDAGAALIGAWAHFQMGDCISAVQWFGQALTWDAERHEARQGIALCQLKQQDYAAAYATARALPPQHPNRGTLLRDALLGQSQRSYEAKDYDAVLAHLHEAAQYGELPRYARQMEGWALFYRGQPDQAGEIFGTLYREQPDLQSAEGALYSLVKAHRMDRLETLATSEPLAGMVNTYYAEKWFDEKRFLLAKDKLPEKFDALGAIGTPRVTLLHGRRDKAGQAGQSRLIHEVSALEAAWPLSFASEIRLKLEHVQLDNGKSMVDGWQPSIEWQHESGDTTFRLQAGLTPVDGPVDPRLVGEASMQRSTPWGNYRIALYMRPVKESVLSYTGEENDPDHGRVVRDGAEVSAYRTLDDQWHVAGKLALERLTGRHVADNTHFAADGSLGYALKPQGFDYLSLSFGVGYEHYVRNLSQFTLGQGGYFSPQTYWHWGPALDFMTAENRQMLLKGRIAIGGLYKQEDRVGRDWGTSYNADIQGVWRLNDYMQLGVSLTKRHAPEYRDFAGLGFLRILFEPRKSVLSADLPGMMSESIY
jgi:tetratricopeptide (TPR) repeat protein